MYRPLISWLRRIKSPHQVENASDEKANRSEELEKIGAELTASENLLAESTSLTEADFTLVGKFIQIYCFCDLNARRIIDTVRFARTGLENEFASSLNETDVLLHLKKCAESWVGPTHIGEGIRRAAVTLEMHRIMRNSFAHWAMRRTADDDGYIMFTMNAGEVKKRGRDPNRRDEATWGLVLRKHVEEEMEKLNGHGEYLAKLAAHLEETRAQLRALH